MPAGGGPARQLTSNPAIDWYASWSPSGRELSFLSQREGENQVWVVDAAGGEPRRLTLGDGTGAEWFPDGQWLVHMRQGKLFRIPAKGGASVPLSTGPHTPSSHRVSRDGRAVYFSVNTGPLENRDLWRVAIGDGARITFSNPSTIHAKISPTVRLHSWPTRRPPVDRADELEAAGKVKRRMSG